MRFIAESFLEINALYYLPKKHAISDRGYPFTSGMIINCYSNVKEKNRSISTEHRGSSK